MSLESERRPKMVGTKLYLCALFFASSNFLFFVALARVYPDKDSFLCYKRIVLRSFLSIALRIPTAHNFARD